MKNNNYQSFVWLSKAIESSNSVLHLETVEKLIENYKRQDMEEQFMDKVEYMFRQKAVLMDYYRWKTSNGADIS